MVKFHLRTDLGALLIDYPPEPPWDGTLPYSAPGPPDQIITLDGVVVDVQTAAVAVHRSHLSTHEAELFVWQFVDRNAPTPAGLADEEEDSMDEAADDGWHEGMDCPDGWQVRRITAEDRAHGIHDYARESAGGEWLIEPIDPAWTPESSS